MQKEIMTERTIALVNSHIEKFPESRVVDIYKLLHQACMGPSHAMTNCANANTWLMQEWDSVDGNPSEELYEDLSLHYPVFRLNLRPAKANNVEPSEISDSFFTLASEFPKNPEVLVSMWDIVSQKIISGKIALPDVEKIDEFNEFIREKQYPSMHHSKEYSEAYSPAYRLVDKMIG